MLKRALNHHIVYHSIASHHAAIHSMLKRALNRLGSKVSSSSPRAAIHSMLKRALNQSKPEVKPAVADRGNPLDAQAGIESGWSAHRPPLYQAAIHSMLKRALNLMDQFSGIWFSATLAAIHSMLKRALNRYSALRPDRAPVRQSTRCSSGH